MPSLLDETDQRSVITGLRLGNRQAWEMLYDGYSVDVWRYVARFVGPEQSDIADVVQETFIAAARASKLFDPEKGSLWCWLTGIAHHHVSRYWKQVKKNARLEELSEAHSGSLSRWLDGFDGTSVAECRSDWLERAELAELVRGVMAKLPSDYAALLAAKYIEDMTLDELARHWGLSVEAIKSKLARARREFREKAGRMLEVNA